MRSLANGRVRGIEKDNAEDDGDHRNTQMENQGSTDQGADGSGDLEKHAHADVGIAFPDVGCGGAAGGGNHGDQRSADGVVNIYTKEEREQGDNHDPAAQAGEGAEEASGE